MPDILLGSSFQAQPRYIRRWNICARTHWPMRTFGIALIVLSDLLKCPLPSILNLIRVSTFSFKIKVVKKNRYPLQVSTQKFSKHFDFRRRVNFGRMSQSRLWILCCPVFAQQKKALLLRTCQILDVCSLIPDFGLMIPENQATEFCTRSANKKNNGIWEDL